MSPVQEVRASSLAQFMQCFGASLIENQLPNESNDAAAAGTAAGELLREMLEQKTLTPVNVPLVASNGVRFDDEMFKFTRMVASNILAQENMTEILCETRIDFSTRSGVMLRGQYDAAYTIGDMLCIDDLKYGYGIVEVEENWQLLAYAIGEYRRLWMMYKYAPTKIRLRILQPRAYHWQGPFREWTITLEQLMHYLEMIEQRMESFVAGAKTLQTGPKCKYCRASISCPAFITSVSNALEHTMETWQEDNISEQAIAEQLELAKRAAELLKIRMDSLTQLGVIRIREGKSVPGYSMVEKFGHRKWTPNITPEAVKMLTGVDIRVQELMSPAKAENLIKKQEFIDSLTVRPSNGFELKAVDTTKIAEKAFGKR